LDFHTPVPYIVFQFSPVFAVAYTCLDGIINLVSCPVVTFEPSPVDILFALGLLEAIHGVEFLTGFKTLVPPIAVGDSLAIIVYTVVNDVDVIVFAVVM